MPILKAPFLLVGNPGMDVRVGGSCAGDERGMNYVCRFLLTFMLPDLLLVGFGNARFWGRSL